MGTECEEWTGGPRSRMIGAGRSALSGTHEQNCWREQRGTVPTGIVLPRHHNVCHLPCPRLPSLTSICGGGGSKSSGCSAPLVLCMISTM